MHNEYELLDSGDGRKLERFGDVVLSRPCGQALLGDTETRNMGEVRCVFRPGARMADAWQRRAALKLGCHDQRHSDETQAHARRSSRRVPGNALVVGLDRRHTQVA